MDLSSLDLQGILKELLKYFNPLIAFLGLSLIQLLKKPLKKILNDDIENEFIALAGIVICIIIAILMKVSVLTGAITGALITGGFSALMDFVRNFGSGNNNTKSQ